MVVHPALLCQQLLSHYERHPGAEQPDDVGEQLRTHLHLPYLCLRGQSVRHFRKCSKVCLMQEMQVNAAYFINTAVQKIRYASLEAFLARHDIIRLFAEFLIGLKHFHRRIAKEVLGALRALVDRSIGVYEIGSHNPIVHTMGALQHLLGG
jgi:hypothetical protein